MRENVFNNFINSTLLFAVSDGFISTFLQDVVNDVTGLMMCTELSCWYPIMIFEYCRMFGINGNIYEHVDLTYVLCHYDQIKEIQVTSQKRRSILTTKTRRLF